MTALSGMKEICQYFRRSEATILALHREMGFPIKKMGGIWESDTELIDAWRREQIGVTEQPAPRIHETPGKRLPATSKPAKRTKTAGR